jgi:hypothetical protein
MQTKWNTITVVTFIFLIVSFWSSGVALIRLLISYQVWNSGALTALSFLLSIPLAILSVVSVKKLLTAMHLRHKRYINFIIAGVLVVHGVALSVYPAVYALVSSSSLLVAGWLLWFGGVVVVTVELVG